MPTTVQTIPQCGQCGATGIPGTTCRRCARGVIEIQNIEIEVPEPEPDPEQIIKEGQKALRKLKSYGVIGGRQAQTLPGLIRGEEGQFFAEKMIEVLDLWENLPAYCKTDDDDPVIFHYFGGGATDIFVTSDDAKKEGIVFTFTCLNGDTQMAEFGAQSLHEITSCNMELDFHWDPTRTLKAAKERIGC